MKFLRIGISTLSVFCVATASANSVTSVDSQRPPARPYTIQKIIEPRPMTIRHSGSPVLTNDISGKERMQSRHIRLQNRMLQGSVMGNAYYMRQAEINARPNMMDMNAGTEHYTNPPMPPEFWHEDMQADDMLPEDYEQMMYETDMDARDGVNEDDIHEKVMQEMYELDMQLQMEMQQKEKESQEEMMRYMQEMYELDMQLQMEMQQKEKESQEEMMRYMQEMYELDMETMNVHDEIPAGYSNEELEEMYQMQQYYQQGWTSSYGDTYGNSSMSDYDVWGSSASAGSMGYSPDELQKIYELQQFIQHQHSAAPRNVSPPHISWPTSAPFIMHNGQNSSVGAASSASYAPMRIEHLPDNWSQMPGEDRQAFAEEKKIALPPHAKHRLFFKPVKAERYVPFRGPLQEEKTFTDAPQIERKEAVQFLQKRGVLDGNADGTFNPKGSINRAESLKVLFEALGEETERQNIAVFADVPPNAWYAPYANKAKEMGIVQGYNDGSFRPSATVSQAELLKIAFESFGLDLSTYSVSELPQDINPDAWYATYLQYAIDNEILDADTVNPETGMTREEFSEVMYRLIQQQENLQ